MIPMKVTGIGLYLPSTIQSAEDLAIKIGKSAEWIIEHTGVHERRIADKTMDEMAAAAAGEAIDKGDPPDCILNASASPLQLIPDSSVFIQEALGYSGIPSWSIHATCLSFLVALNQAAALIHAKSFRRILIVSSEAGAGWRNFDEPESASLIGDGAAAVIVEPSGTEDSSQWIDWTMATFPEGARLTEFRGAGTRKPPGYPHTRPEDNLFSMDGPNIYRMARRKGFKVLLPFLKRNNIIPTDVDCFVFHQASGPALKSIQRYGFSSEHVVNVIAKYGNTIAASIPMALVTAVRAGQIKRKDLVLLGGTGAGLSMSFGLLRW